MPTLYIFSGLPGSGKTTLSKGLSQSLSAVHLRIDTIEQALRDLCHIQVEGEGYRLAYRIAADNLRLGRDVVADSCNPIPLTRTEWQDVADSAKASHRNIEVCCSDANEHQQRVRSRASDIPGLQLPTWADVSARHYVPWTEDRIIIDTAGETENASLEKLMVLIRT